MDHVGQFKSGSEMYTRENMSDPDREATNVLLDSLYQRITQDIAQDRKLSGDTVRALVDQSPLVSSELKSKGLVDDLIYRDQLESIIKKQLNLKELHSISAVEYQKPSFRESIKEKPDKIALIYATGTILPGESYRGFGEDFVGSSTVSNSFKNAREDSSVKAIVFRVDSPGGSPSASDMDPGAKSPSRPKRSRSSCLWPMLQQAEATTFRWEPAKFLLNHLRLPVPLEFMEASLF